MLQNSILVGTFDFVYIFANLCIKLLHTQMFLFANFGVYTTCKFEGLLVFFFFQNLISFELLNYNTTIYNIVVSWLVIEFDQFVLFLEYLKILYVYKLVYQHIMMLLFLVLILTVLILLHLEKYLYSKLNTLFSILCVYFNQIQISNYQINLNVRQFKLHDLCRYLICIQYFFSIHVLRHCFRYTQGYHMFLLLKCTEYKTSFYALI
eukprot:TRINITY_DN2108_c0_g1_i2.p1 TRINITY_DN2108_c0_g1~~TRINITY_DN2108_c0_g1_i2.p1  ORF type:complete len:225 (+),score=-31.34 TRINITY_DN2108_c0_g1_i2:57-677(+)